VATPPRLGDIPVAACSVSSQGRSSWVTQHPRGLLPLSGAWADSMVVKTDVYSGFPAVAAVVDDSSRAVLEDCLSLLVRLLACWARKHLSRVSCSWMLTWLVFAVHRILWETCLRSLACFRLCRPLWRAWLSRPSSASTFVSSRYAAWTPHACRPGCKGLQKLLDSVS
jgi:hypothetical protein